MGLTISGVIPFAFPGLEGVRCAFTTRMTGNVSLYRAARGDESPDDTRAARQALRTGLGVAWWTEVMQVHGDHMLFDPAPTDPDDEPVQEADGLACAKKGQALMVKTADCQPILLAHPAGYVAAIHAGWRGNVLGFPTTAVQRFCEQYSLDPAEVRAVRGPSLGWAEFVNFDREWPEEFRPWFDPRTRTMDLWSLTRHQLTLAGLLPGRIFGLDLCTMSLNRLFYSHRQGDTGRQAAFIWLS